MACPTGGSPRNRYGVQLLERGLEPLAGRRKILPQDQGAREAQQKSVIGGAQNRVEKLPGRLALIGEHRTHAAADVQQHGDGQGQVRFAGEVADLLLAPVLADLKVFFGEIGHQRSALVRNGAEDVDDVHVDMDGAWFVGGLREQRRSQ